MDQPELTVDQRQALDENRGFVQGSSFVLMSIDLYRDMMGVGSDAALQESLSAIEEGIQDVEAGRVHDAKTVFEELDKNYGVQG